MQGHDVAGRAAPHCVFMRRSLGALSLEPWRRTFHPLPPRVLQYFQSEQIRPARRGPLHAIAPYCTFRFFHFPQTPGCAHPLQEPVIGDHFGAKTGRLERKPVLLPDNLEVIALWVEPGRVVTGSTQRGCVAKNQRVRDCLGAHLCPRAPASCRKIKLLENQINHALALLKNHYE